MKLIRKYADTNFSTSILRVFYHLDILSIKLFIYTKAIEELSPSLTYYKIKQQESSQWIRYELCQVYPALGQTMTPQALQEIQGLGYICYELTLSEKIVLINAKLSLHYY